MTDQSFRVAIRNEHLHFPSHHELQWLRLPRANDPEETVVTSGLPYTTKLAGAPASRFLNPRTLYTILAILFVALLTFVIMYLKRGTELGNAQGDVERLQTQVAGLDRQISELKSTLAQKDPQPIVNGISAIIDQGKIWHAISFTNETGMDLHEGNVTILLIGEDGKEKSEAKYFAAWRNGDREYVSISSANSPSNVKKYTMRGKCSEGYINQSWTP